MAELLKSEMRELDPCPFCGGTATRCKDRQRYWVECIDGCGAKTAVYKSADDAAQAWNQRDDEWRIEAVELPAEKDEMVFVIVSGKPTENVTLHDAVQIAEYDPNDPDNPWIIEKWPEWKEAAVSHWKPLPDPPKGVRHGTDCSV